MVRNLEAWQWSSYLAFIGKAKVNEWLTTDWVLSQFGSNQQHAVENYQRFVLAGVGRKIDIWSGLKGQIYLGNEQFVSAMQSIIGDEKSVNDRSIPKKQKRPVAKTLVQIEKQHPDRNSAIVAAYTTGAYSQREIAEHYKLHPSTVGLIVRRGKGS